MREFLIDGECSPKATRMRLHRVNDRIELQATNDGTWHSILTFYDDGSVGRDTVPHSLGFVLTQNQELDIA